MACRVVAGEFDTVHLPVSIIERSENDRRAELTLIDQIRGLLVVAVHAHRKGRGQLLLYADIVVIRAFGPHHVSGCDFGRSGGIDELEYVGVGNELERRWREEAR